MNTCKSYAETHRAGPGASTVLLILLVMCLAMLGALSLSVARNDLAVTKRAMEAETAYYKAQSAAAEALAMADEALINARPAAGEPAAWAAALESIEGYMPDTGLIAMDIPVDEYRTIRLVLEPNDPEENARYTVVENRVSINQSSGGENDQF